MLDERIFLRTFYVHVQYVVILLNFFFDFFIPKTYFLFELQ